MKPYNGFTPQQRQEAFNWLKEQNKPKPTICEACGQEWGLIEPHSEDYSKPFGEHIGKYGLCYICHSMIHCRFRAREEWLNYIENVEKKGLIYVNPYYRNWLDFRTRFLMRTKEPLIMKYRDLNAEKYDLLSRIEAGNA